MMKKIASLVLVAGFTMLAWGQNTNKIGLTGNVGIGTINPQESLHVIGKIQQEIDDAVTAKQSKIHVGSYGIFTYNNTNEMYYRSMYKTTRGGYTLNDPVVDNAWVYSQEMIIHDVNGWRELITPTLRLVGQSANNKYIYSFNAGGYNSGTKYLALTNQSGNYRVGILTDNPSEAFDVNGNSIIRGRFQIGNSSTSWINDQITGYSNGMVSNDGALFVPVNKNNVSDLRLYLPDDYNDAFSIWGNTCGGGDCGNLNAASQVVRFEAGGEVMFFGNVGIGTTTPSTKLDVAGNIKAHEIEVTLANMQDLQLNGTLVANNITYTANGNTADFVFEDNYQLKDLAEVEAFIKANKHLPEIPSAAEMEESGVNLAEMNKLLLMKVEELTLYSIELEKEVKRQKAEVDEEREEWRLMRGDMEECLELKVKELTLYMIEQQKEIEKLKILITNDYN